MMTADAHCFENHQSFFSSIILMRHLSLVQLCYRHSRLHAERLLAPLSSKDVSKHDCICQYRSQSHQRTGYLDRK